MLVWTGAMLTQCGSTVKGDHKVENTRRKISLTRTLGEQSLECRVPPKVATCRVSPVGCGPWGLGDMGENRAGCL